MPSRTPPSPVPPSPRSGPAEPSPERLAWIREQVRGVELRTKGMVASMLAGDAPSPFRGGGLEAAGVREYRPGDEVRSIDWKVTARRGRLHVKEFAAERDRTVLLVVDRSGSVGPGPGGDRARLAVDAAGGLALAGAAAGDRVGLLQVSDRVESRLRPGRGRRHALRLVRDLVTLRPARIGTDLSVGLDRAPSFLEGRGIVLVLSDFAVEAAERSRLERSLRSLSRRHEVVPVPLLDPREDELPRAGVLELVDPETGAPVLVNTSSPRAREAFRTAVRVRRVQVEALFRRVGLRPLVLAPGEPHGLPVRRYFDRRGSLR